MVIASSISMLPPEISPLPPKMLVLDDGRGIELAVQNDGHLLALVLAGDVGEFVCAGAVKCEIR